jgi:iron complex transport system ATP-binding protein
MMLAADGISVRYAETARPAIDRVTFGVTAGELVAVAGPNGCGKTTLLRALLGTVPRVAGSVQLQGRAIDTWSRRDVARVVGALPQREEPAFPMSVRDAIMLGRWAHLGAFASPGARDIAAVTAAVARCDVGALLDRSIDNLSGGEWQRVRLARTLAAEPRLMLLDEPTAALDVGHEMALFELLAALAGEGLAIVVVTHHLNVAARFASRVVLMKEGGVVIDGAPRVAMDAAMLSTLFDWPVQVSALADGSPQYVAERRPDVPLPG